jgi:hypothetical protein
MDEYVDGMTIRTDEPECESERSEMMAMRMRSRVALKSA